MRKDGWPTENMQSPSACSQQTSATIGQKHVALHLRRGCQLTSMTRSQNLQHLLSLSPSNHAAYQTLTSTVFALSLDAYSYALPASQQTSDSDLTAHLHNVRSGHGAYPGHNRWYDKPFTLIVEANTRVGVLGEHSPVDALVPSIVADYAIVQGVDEDAFPERLGPQHELLVDLEVTSSFDGWERIEWIVDEHIVQECSEAATRAKVIVDDSDVDELVFDSYGTRWIKDEGLPLI